MKLYTSHSITEACPPSSYPPEGTRKSLDSKNESLLNSEHYVYHNFLFILFIYLDFIYFNIYVYNIYNLYIF